MPWSGVTLGTASGVQAPGGVFNYEVLSVETPGDTVQEEKRHHLNEIVGLLKEVLRLLILRKRYVDP